MADVWKASGSLVAVAAAAVFFIMGYRRGVRREITTLLGVAVGWVAANLMQPSVVVRLNQCYKGLRFFLAGLVGGEGDAMWVRVQTLPDPLQPEEDVRALALLVFFVVTAAFYVWAHRRLPPEVRIPGRVLGGLTGVASGALFAAGCLRLLGSPTIAMALPIGGVSARAVGNDTAALAVVVVAALVIAYGLYSASGTGQQ